MMVTQQTPQLEEGRKYTLIVGNKGETLEVLYLGKVVRQPVYFPHEFIGRAPIGGSDSIISFRIREGGFKVKADLVAPIPEKDGRAFFTNIYSSSFSHEVGQVGVEERSRLLAKLREAGL